MTLEKKLYEELEDWKNAVVEITINYYPKNTPSTKYDYKSIEKYFRKEIIDEVVKRLEQRTTVIMQDDDGVIFKKYN